MDNDDKPTAFTTLAVPGPSGASESAQASGSIPTTTVRVGVTGAICDLDSQDKRDDVADLFAKEMKLASQLAEVEGKRLKCHNPWQAAQLIVRCKSTKRSVRKELEQHTQRLEKKKKALEDEMTQVRQKLAAIDPRLTDGAGRLPIFLPGSPSGRNVRERKPNEDVAARDAMIARLFKHTARYICRELDFRFPYDAKDHRPAPQLPDQWFKDGAKTFSEAHRMFPNRVHKLISIAKRTRTITLD